MMSINRKELFNKEHADKYKAYSYMRDDGTVVYSTTNQESPEQLLKLSNYARKGTAVLYYLDEYRVGDIVSYDRDFWVLSQIKDTDAVLVSATKITTVPLTALILLQCAEETIAQFEEAICEQAR